jgi:hypothetical protein
LLTASFVREGNAFDCGHAASVARTPVCRQS